jgi:type III pantothenate kinase
VQALQSGAILGYAGLVEGLVSRLRADLGRPVQAIATGGLAPLIVPETSVFAHIDPDLTLHGIRIAWERLRDAGRGR